MKYEEAYAFIEECNKLGSVPGLETIEELAAELSNPQDQLKFIHIAGTNGKGSVLSYLSTVLKTAGFRVGRYLSPTIYTYLERFQINGRNISRQKFADYIGVIREACERITAKGHKHPTSFEIETVLSFLFFRDSGCDIVVLETGMGGRLDATNLIHTPVLCVLASISMDHMQFLGETLSEIAANKCGIIKEGVPVVSLLQEKEAMEVIRKTCQNKNAPLYIADRQKLKKIKYGLEKQSFFYEGRKYEIAIPGTWQIDNAMLAIEALHCLPGEFKVSDKSIINGLLKTVWKGRFSVIAKNPYFIIDGAHNEDAAKRLMESIDLYFTNRRIIYIIGMFKDKEYEKVAAITSKKAEQIITITPPNPQRALEAFELAKVIKNTNQKVTAADSLEEAVEMAYLFADRKSVIIAFGSLSYLGKISGIVENKAAVRSDVHGKQREN